MKKSIPIFIGGMGFIDDPHVGALAEFEFVVPASPIKLPKSASGSFAFASKLGVLELRGILGSVIGRDPLLGVCLRIESQLPIRDSSDG